MGVKVINSFLAQRLKKSLNDRQIAYQMRRYSSSGKKVMAMRKLRITATAKSAEAGNALPCGIREMPLNHIILGGIRMGCETCGIPAKQSAIPVVEAYLLGCEVGFDRIPAKAFGSGKRLYAVFAKDDRR